MRTISCKLEDLKTMTLHIGYEGENDYTSVRIDAGSVFAQYPEAVPSLKVQPPKGNMYPVIVTRDGDIVIWNVSDSDTASNGNGEIQLTFTENTVVVKSCTGKTLVHRSLKATGPAPDPLIDFIDRAEEVVGEAQDAAEAAEAAAQHAPMIGLDGYWYKWDAETEGYVKTDTKARGEDGANGVGITSVEKISTVGLVDTYRINFTNGTNTTYTVTNGQDGSVPIDDTTPAANKVFSSAKVDEELTDVKNHIHQMNTATASDVGKALSPKTVTDGEVAEWQFVSGGGGSVDPSVVEQKVDEWLEENISNPDSPPLDRSLSSGSAAAPADMVGTITQKTRNIFDETVFKNATGIELGEDGYWYGKVSAWIAAFSSLLPVDAEYEAGIRYMISGSYYFSNTGGNSYSVATIRATYSDDTANNVQILSSSNITAKDFASATIDGKNVDHIAFYLNDWHGNNYYLHIKNLQIEKGTIASKYVPHRTAYDCVAEDEAFANTEKIYALEEEVSNKPSLEDIIPGVISFDDWEVGDINSSGQNISSTSVIRTAGYHKFPASHSIYVKPLNNYKCGVKWYSYENGVYTYVGTLTASTDDFAFAVNNKYFYRFVIGYGTSGQTANVNWSKNIGFVNISYVDLDSFGYNMGIAHRCLMGYAPEETKAGILMSKKYGFDYAECDIQFSSDGVPVLIHDTTVDRTSDGTGNVSSLTYAQLRELDFGSYFSSDFAGEKILSLELALEIAKGVGIGLCMEVRSDITDAQLELVVNTICSVGMERHVIICGKAAHLIKVYALRKDINVALLDGDNITQEKIDSVASILSDTHTVYFMSAAEYRTSSVEVAKANNVPVILHTLNTIESVTITDDYVCGALSNYFNYKVIKAASNLI